MEKNIHTYIYMTWAMIQEWGAIRGSLQTKDLIVEHSVKIINGVVAS